MGSTEQASFAFSFSSSATLRIPFKCYCPAHIPPHYLLPMHLLRPYSIYSQHNFSARITRNSLLGCYSKLSRNSITALGKTARWARAQGVRKGGVIKVDGDGDGGFHERDRVVTVRYVSGIANDDSNLIYRRRKRRRSVENSRPHIPSHALLGSYFQKTASAK